MGSDDYHGRDDNDGVTTALAQTDLRAVVRPKYVRPAASWEGGDGGQLGFWVKLGVSVSRLMSGEGAACALCRRFRRRKKRPSKVCLSF